MYASTHPPPSNHLQQQSSTYTGNTKKDKFLLLRGMPNRERHFFDSNLKELTSVILALCFYFYSAINIQSKLKLRRSKNFAFA
jgi:hypothetical protein